MLALRIEKFGPPSALAIGEISQPAPRPEEVLVRVEAAGLNPSDVKNLAGMFHQTTLPRTLGRDFAGVVVEGPREWLDVEVWGSASQLGFQRDGSHAEYVAAPQQAIRHKPAQLTMAEAAAVGVPFITAWTALLRTGALQTGETVLIVGSSGAVGSAAVQIARWKGAQVIGAALNAKDESGAHLHVDTSREALSDAVNRLTEGRGVDLALDTVGGPMFEPVLRSLARKGRQVAIASSGGTRVSFDLVDFYHRELHLVGVDTLALADEVYGEIYDALRPGFEAGALRAPAVKTYTLSQGRDAYQAVHAGTAGAKVVLVPRPL